MKTLKTILAIFIFTFIINLSPSAAQDQKTSTYHNKYDTWVKLNNKNLYTGLLLDVHKDALVLLDNNGESLPLNFESKVSYFELRKKGRITNGIIVGALSGSIIGGAIGYIGGRPSPGEWDFHQETTMALGLAGGVIGGLIGGLIGATKIKIIINGNKNLNNEQLQKLKKRDLLTP